MVQRGHGPDGIRARPCSSRCWLVSSSVSTLPQSYQPATGAVSSRRPRSTMYWNAAVGCSPRSEEHTSELQSQSNLVCRLLLEKKNTQHTSNVGQNMTVTV